MRKKKVNRISMKDYIFLTVIIGLAVFFIIKEIRNDSLEMQLRGSKKEQQAQYDSLSNKIDDLEKLILQMDSVKTINNNYYTEVIKESNEIIKADSNNAYGLFRKQLNALTNH